MIEYNDFVLWKNIKTKRRMIKETVILHLYTFSCHSEGSILKYSLDSNYFNLISL